MLQPTVPDRRHPDERSVHEPIQASHTSIRCGIGVVQMEQKPRAIGARLSSPVSSSLLARLAFFGVTEGIGLLAIEI
jgi:hypothetical protein